jgi:methionyl-tRNA formyltransferase
MSALAQPPTLPLRAIFFGTGDIARPAFQALRERTDIHLLGLVTQPDKPVGRHQVLTPPAIKLDAVAAGVPVWQPEKAGQMIEEWRALSPDIFVVMAYGQILPQSLIDVPTLVCWNLHASLLPRHRGASPIQAALLAGDRETGVTVMHVVRALDAGDIVLPESITIEPGETGGHLHDRLAALAPVAMNRALDLLVQGKAPRVPQDPGRVTVLGKLERAHGLLDWSRPADELARRIHAFDPWPGTFTHLPGGKVLKVYPPVEAETLNGPAGTLLSADPHGLLVACGKGSLRVTHIQPEGKKRMSAADFLRGHPLSPSSMLGFPIDPRQSQQP